MEDAREFIKVAVTAREALGGQLDVTQEHKTALGHKLIVVHGGLSVLEVALQDGPHFQRIGKGDTLNLIEGHQVVVVHNTRSAS